MKKKLVLNQLKVKSFVTDQENKSKNTVKGGFTVLGTHCYTNTNCGTACYSCDPLTCDESNLVACV